MRIYFVIFCLLLLNCGKTESQRQAKSAKVGTYGTPDVLLGDLFKDVQLSNIFHDSKTFVDCEAKIPYDSILKLYKDQKDTRNFNLKRFVTTYFKKPKHKNEHFITDSTHTPSQHIKALWPVLTRQGENSKPRNSLIELPNDYVIPGGRFREVYYWDSYFTMLGLVESKEFEIIEDMLDNFAYLITTFGHIPNGNRTYYLSRSQPPFFAQMIELLAQYKGDYVYEKYRQSLRKEYEFWMENEESDSAYNHIVNTKFGKMNRYYDALNQPRQESFKEDYKLAKVFPRNKSLYRNIRAGAESGWDFSSRWLTDKKSLKTIEVLHIVPVDLNALLYGMETVLVECYRHSDAVFVNQLKDSQNNRIQFLNEKSYNIELGVFEDYNFKTDEKTGRLSLAMVYPLFFKMATQEQANNIANYIEKHFLKPGGVVTTNYETGEQWDAPNGWAPLQWLTVVGLEHYGYKSLAQTIMLRWTRLNENVYKNTGKFVEKYNVEDLSLEAGGGEYALQDGFGWSNGVYLAFKRKLELDILSFKY